MAGEPAEPVDLEEEDEGVIESGDDGLALPTDLPDELDDTIESDTH